MKKNIDNEKNLKKNFKNKFRYKKKYKKKTNVFCGNCGKCGHIYKECRQPIISLGIILYRINLKGDREYLLIMRKDTLGYVELIRGNYPLNDIGYLQNIIEEMTINEKKRLLSDNFDSLWNDLWVENEEKKLKYRSEFYKSMINFNKLSLGLNISNEEIKLDELILNSKSKWEEPEWGFPKGRRNLREKDLNCALREFEEETDINRNDINVRQHIKPFVEEFVGSNNKIYKHIYYLAEMNKIIKPEINPSKTIQMIEIGDIKWLSLKEAIKKIREYDIAKKNVLKEVDEYLENIKNKSTSNKLLSINNKDTNVDLQDLKNSNINKNVNNNNEINVLLETKPKFIKKQDIKNFKLMNNISDNNLIEIM